MSAQLIELLTSSSAVILTHDQVLELLANLEKPNKYDDYTEEQKKAIYQLSSAYIVRYCETDVTTLDLIAVQHLFHSQTQNVLQEKISKTSKYEIVYSSSLIKQDVRRSTIPSVDYLNYGCSCDQFCTCDYVNLPKIDITGKITVVNNGGTPIELTKSQYETYLTIKPAFLFKHKFVNNKEEDIIINYNSYFVEYVGHVIGSANNEIRSSFATLVRQSAKSYKLCIRDKYFDGSFLFLDKVCEAMKTINIVEANYKPEALKDVDKKYFAIENKINILNMQTSLVLIYHKD